MNSAQIDEKLRKLDGRGAAEEYEAVESLSTLGDEFPILLLQRYRIARNWAERASCVYHAAKYARTSDAAFQLGIEAIADRSKKVRYRACLLLAVAQKREALPHLASLVPEFQSAYVTAAIDAIEHGNQNYFIDRDHSGMITLNVQQIRS